MMRQQAQRIIRATERDAEGRAAKLIADAQAEAAAIRAGAHADVATWRAEVEREARAAAHQATARQLLAASGARARAIADLREDAVEVVRDATERLLRDTLADDPARIAVIVDALLRPLVDAERCVVSVHPDDAPHLASLRPDETDFELLPDPSLSRGDCTIDSNIGRVDARIEMQLDALTAALREALA